MQKHTKSDKLCERLHDKQPAKPYKPPIDEELEAAGYVKSENGQWYYPVEPDVYGEMTAAPAATTEDQVASDQAEPEPEFLEFDRGGSLMGNTER